MRLTALIGFLLAALLPAHGQSPQQLFERANQLYQQKKYDSAENLYGQLVEQGYRNTALLYNAGNASYRAGHTGYAVYYYEKALRRDPGNEVIRHNLQLANQQVSDRTEPLPPLIFIQWGEKLLSLLSPNGWLAVSLLLGWLLVLFIALRVLKERKGRAIRWGTYGSGVLFVLLLTTSFFSYREASRHDAAVVVAPVTDLRAAPDADSPGILQVHEGLKVKLLNTAPGWMKISLSDGREGWVAGGDLRII